MVGNRQVTFPEGGPSSMVETVTCKLGVYSAIWRIEAENRSKNASNHVNVWKFFVRSLIGKCTKTRSHPPF